MNRRTLIAGTAVVLAGCTARGEQSDGSDAGGDDDGEAIDEAGGGDDSGDENGGGNDERSETSETSESSEKGDEGTYTDDGIDDDLALTFAETPPEVAAGAVDVAVDADELHIDGTVTGETGCHVPTVETATVEGDELQLVVSAVSDAAPEQLCTLALTEVGYEVDVGFAGDLPTEVTVVHDDAVGRKTVAAEPLPSDAVSTGGTDGT